MTEENGNTTVESGKELVKGYKTTRRLLTDIFIDNAHLHKLVNSLTLKTLIGDSKVDKALVNEAVPPRKSMLYRFL